MTSIKRSFFLVSLVLVLVHITSCEIKSDKRYEEQKNSLADHIGEKFKLSNILDSTGNLIELNFTESEITIIDFWFNECPPCIAEMKQFAGLLSGKESKIAVLSISLNQFWLWKPTLTEHKGRFTFLGDKISNWKHYTLQSIQDVKLKNDISTDRLEELEKVYNVTFFPAYFVVDKNGIILSRPESAVEYIKGYN